MNDPRRKLETVTEPGRTALAFLIAIPATLLPARYRRRFTAAPESQLLRPAAVSAAIQTAVASMAYIATFLATRQSYPMFPVLEYLVDIRRIPVGYVAVEGAVRWLSAVHSQEVLPSLPFVIIERLHRQRDRRKERRRVGPPVSDRVTRGDGVICDWCVESWGAKPEWDRNPYLMIAYRDEFYEIVGRETRQPPREHVYLLKKPPSWKLVVKPYRYDPETDRGT